MKRLLARWGSLGATVVVNAEHDECPRDPSGTLRIANNKVEQGLRTGLSSTT